MAFVRGKKARERKVAKAKRRKMLGVKSVGASAIRKGPARDENHLAKVRQNFCLLYAEEHASYGQSFPTEAHHVRSLTPRTMGVRVSDYLTVPLCRACHALLHMYGNEAKWWKVQKINPADFIAQFSKEGAAEIARYVKETP